jgi:hypothetical protein
MREGGSVSYRSQVAFACTEEVHEIVIAAAEMNKEFKEFLMADDLWRGVNDETPSNAMKSGTEGRYFWESVKYYDGHACVDALNGIMGFLDDLGKDAEYGFIKIGEEMDDNELQGDPSSFDLYINRSIEL